MKARFKIGLIVGLVGLVLNICATLFSGLCGPAVALVAGGIAGFFAARQEKPATKSDGAQAGGIAGAVAGGLMIIGQLIGGVGSLIYLQSTNTQLPFGTIPPVSADMSQQLIFYLSGLGTGCCIGLVGTVLAALTGAGAGFLGTPEPEPQIPPM